MTHMTPPTAPPTTSHKSLLGATLVGGFATALVLWTAWFITHLPWTGVPEQVSLLLLVVVWALSLAVVGWSIGGPAGVPRDGWKVGLGAGLLSALIGLLVLGTKLTDTSDAAQATQTAASLKPNALLIVLGFLATGAVLGALMGTAGAHLRRCRCSPTPNWLARFAVVCVLTTAPLLFIGGLVTSTNSGMAVPDWPNTYGSTMFTYPLGPRVHISGDEHLQPDTWQKLLNKEQIAQAEAMTPDLRADFIGRIATQKIFLEHSHRLFGALLGLCSIVLLAWTFAARKETAPRVLASIAFLVICTQGVLGGLRVNLDSRVLSLTHGVLAQITLAILVVLAVRLHSAYAGATDAHTRSAATRARIFATAALHTTIIQLIFGAVFRHFRSSSHALWTHMGFSVLVVTFVIFAALFSVRLVSLDREAGRDQPFFPTLHRLAIALMVVIGMQFVLGFTALMFGNIRVADPATVAQALFRTIHQANGAVTLALVVAVWSIIRRVAPKKSQTA